MAEVKRKKRRKKSLGGYFRNVFTENPEWLDLRSNDLVQAKYEADHPGKKLTTAVRSNMANIKSVMRQENRKGGKKPGTGAGPRGLNANMEALEIAINDCLATARKLNPDGLKKVIEYLRHARYRLVLKMGEP